MSERILRAVAKRNDLDDNEIDELRQLTQRDGALDQVVEHGARIAKRRRFVADWTREHPTSTESEAAGRFDRMNPITAAPAGGRKFLASLLAQSTDHRTSKFFSSVGGRTRRSDESQADRTARINERLAAAGYRVEDHGAPGWSAEGERRL